MGVLAAVAAGRGVRGMLYEVAPSDPAVLIGATAALILCAGSVLVVIAHRLTRGVVSELLGAE